MNKNKTCLATITFRCKGSKKESVRGAIFRKTDLLWEVPLKWNIPFSAVKKINIIKIGE